MRSLSMIGGVLTGCYVVFVGWVIQHNWTDFAELAPNEWGDFFAGSLGPLAIFWLVLGFVQQGRELRHSVEALNLQAEELRKSVEQQQAMVKITEQQLELEIQMRDKEHQLAANRALPFFQLSKQPNEIIPAISITQSLTFNLRNSGADAISVSLFVAPESFAPDPRNFDSFPKNTTSQVRLPVEPDLQEPPTVVIESVSLKKQRRRQEFQFGHDGARMISCFPEHQ
ncbi:MAG: hypothetical protein AAGF56_00025 [Pseudomonadota bacterium]